eukprot:CAMPEP_0119282992 /NCGR_PEP_ID=MMETSP1329-20130426/27663_1 /TAXON_ID=114041 /ORGANISM="Genus nov. species nov., Strain RCC1024" /LENGTH=87 /DNA_ID=CAMNT_0007283657 /DNA_START=102 /DNA_END=362 /DNA_ORIENTATION=+
MATEVLVRVADRQAKIVCAPGMAINELRFVLGSAFEVDARHIAGLISEEGVCSPLSLLSKSPASFANRRYALLIKPEAFPASTRGEP